MGKKERMEGEANLDGYHHLSCRLGETAPWHGARKTALSPAEISLGRASHQAVARAKEALVEAVDIF